MFLCLLVMALLFLAVGGVDALALAAGRHTSAMVRSCATEVHSSGRSWRHQTRCNVAVADLGQRDIDTSAPHPGGTRITVLVLRGQVIDQRLAYAQMWFLLPVPLLLAVAWRKGWPKHG